MKRLLYSLAYLVLLGLPALLMLIYVGYRVDWPALFVTVLLIFGVGGVFDIWATRQSRQSRRDAFFIWEYNSRSILGFKLYGVPIEDFVFFLTLTPLFIVAIYETIRETVLTQTLWPGLLIIIIDLISYHAIYQSAIREKKKR